MHALRQLLHSVLFLGAVAVVLLIYSRGWTGTFHFDDHVNLFALETFLAQGDWLAVVGSGQSGPGGRSIALASFLIDAPAWSHDPGPFLRTNTMIHGLNGLLLALVYLQLAKLAGVRAEARNTVALVAAALWLTLPLLASSTLLVVQRMTTLAATFMLLGLLVHLLGRAQAIRRPGRGIPMMWLGLGGGTVLGFLTKEHAALLPLLALVIEATLARGRPAPRGVGWQATKLLLLTLPSGIVAAYVLSRIPGANFSHRDFSLPERLATQTVILWDYLRLMFLPRVAEFSPFHDSHPVYRWSDPIVWLAAGAWVAVLLVAALRIRQWPLFAFAVFWFLGAHLIESTAIPLELYFEHRNYFPAIGPVFALIAGTVGVATRFQWGRLAGIAGAAYLSLMAAMLLQVTSLWGQPALAAEMWHMQAPESRRAAAYLSEELMATGDFRTAYAVLKQAQEHNPNHGGLSLQLLRMSCQLRKSADEQRLRLDAAQNNMRSGIVDSAALYHLVRAFAARSSCPEILSLEQLEQFALDGLANPQHREGRKGRALLHRFQAEIQRAQGDFPGTFSALERSLREFPDLSTLREMVDLLNSAGLHAEALAVIQDVTPPSLRDPLKKNHWMRGLEALTSSQERLVQQRGSD